MKNNLDLIFTKFEQKALVCASVGTTVLSSVMCFAEDTTSADIATSMGLIATKILATIGAVALVALPIAGVILAWRYGIKFFKMASK